MYIIILTLLVAQKTEATSFKDAASFVSSIEKNSETFTYESIVSDYNKDGKDDVAILLHSTSPSRSGYQLAVLIKNQVNSFDPLEMSKFGDSSNGFSAKLTTKNGGLFVYIAYSADAGHLFRAMPAGYSAACRPPVPPHVGRA
jgi:hypothetical protein